MLAALSEDDRDFVSGIFEEYGKQMYSIALDILKNDWMQMMPCKKQCIKS